MADSTVFPEFPTTYTEKDELRLQELEAKKQELQTAYGQKFSPQAWSQQGFVEKGFREVASEIPMAGTVISWLTPSNWLYDIGLVPEDVENEIKNTNQEYSELLRRKTVNEALPDIKTTIDYLAVAGKAISTIEDFNQLFKLKSIGFTDEEVNSVMEYARQVSTMDVKDILTGKTTSVTDKDIVDWLTENMPELAPTYIMSSVAFSKDADEIQRALQAAYPPETFMTDEELHAAAFAKAVGDMDALLEYLGLEKIEDESTTDMVGRVLDAMTKRGNVILLEDSDTGNLFPARKDTDGYVWLTDPDTKEETLLGYMDEDGNLVPVDPRTLQPLTGAVAEAWYKDLFDMFYATGMKTWHTTVEGILTMFAGASDVERFSGVTSAQTPVDSGEIIGGLGTLSYVWEMTQDGKVVLNEDIDLTIPEGERGQVQATILQQLGIPITSFAPETQKRLKEYQMETTNYFQKLHDSVEASNNEWWANHPELAKRPGYDTPFWQDWSLLADPWYWGYTITDMVPVVATYTAATIATGGNVVLGTALGTGILLPSMVEDNYDAAIAAGASPTEARNIAIGVGIGQSAIFMLPAAITLKSVSPVMNTLLRRTAQTTAKEAVGSAIAHSLATFGKIEATGVAIMATQKIMQNIALTTINPDIGIFDEVSETMAHSAVSFLPLALLGGVSQYKAMKNELGKSKQGQEVVKDIEERKAELDKGFEEAKIPVPEDIKEAIAYTDVINRSEQTRQVVKKAQEKVESAIPEAKDGITAKKNEVASKIAKIEKEVKIRTETVAKTAEELSKLRESGLTDTQTTSKLKSLEKQEAQNLRILKQLAEEKKRLIQDQANLTTAEGIERAQKQLEEAGKRAGEEAKAKAKKPTERTTYSKKFTSPDEARAWAEAQGLKEGEYKLSIKRDNVSEEITSVRVAYKRSVLEGRGVKEVVSEVTTKKISEIEKGDIVTDSLDREWEVVDASNPYELTVKTPFGGITTIRREQLKISKIEEQVVKVDKTDALPPTEVAEEGEAPKVIQNLPANRSEIRTLKITEDESYFPESIWDVMSRREQSLDNNSALDSVTITRKYKKQVFEEGKVNLEELQERIRVFDEIRGKTKSGKAKKVPDELKPENETIKGLVKDFSDKTSLSQKVIRTKSWDEMNYQERSQVAMSAVDDGSITFFKKHIKDKVPSEKWFEDARIVMAKMESESKGLVPAGRITERMMRTVGMIEAMRDDVVNRFKSLKDFDRIVNDDEASARVAEWVNSKDEARTGVKRPVNITPEEIAVGDLVSKIYDEWKPVVRFLRCIEAFEEVKDNSGISLKKIQDKKFFHKEDKIFDVMEDSIKVYEQQGEQALWKFLYNKEGGVIDTGYDMLKITFPSLKTKVVGLSESRGRGQLLKRSVESGLDATDAHKIFLRLESYIQGVGVRFFMNRDIKALADAHRAFYDKWTDGKQVENYLTEFMRNIQGIREPGHPIATPMNKAYGFAAPVIFFKPALSIRNTAQPGFAFPFRKQLFKSLVTFRRLPEDVQSLVKTYFRYNVDQSTTGFRHLTDMGGNSIFTIDILRTKNPFSLLNRITRKYSMFPKTDYITRMPSFTAAFEKAYKAGLQFQKDGNAKKWIKNSGVTKLSKECRDNILEVLSMDEYDMTMPGIRKATGVEASSIMLAENIVADYLYVYKRYQRSAAEWGQFGQAAGSLMVFPRSTITLFARELFKLKDPDIPIGEKVGVVRNVTTMIVMGAVVGGVLKQVLGTERDEYSIINMVDWNLGGLQIALMTDILTTISDIAHLAAWGTPEDKSNYWSDLTYKLPRLGDNFIGLYNIGMSGLEIALGEKSGLDKRWLREIRSWIDNNYTPEEQDKIERDWIENIQHILTGTQDPELSVVDEYLDLAREAEGQLGAELPDGTHYNLKDFAGDMNQILDSLPSDIVSTEYGFPPLLDFYAECRLKWAEYDTIPTQARDDWKMTHLTETAMMLFWGKLSNVPSGMSYDDRMIIERILSSWIDLYGITKAEHPYFDNWGVGG